MIHLCTLLLVEMVLELGPGTRTVRPPETLKYVDLI